MTVYRIKYKNEYGAKMFQFGIDNSMKDDVFIIKSYGAGGGTMELNNVESFYDIMHNTKGMRYIKCNVDMFYKLSDRYSK